LIIFAIYIIYQYHIFPVMELSKNKLLAIIVVVIILVSILGFALWWVGTNNKMVRESEQIDSQWAQVANEYQRKIDLIPQLVSIASGYQQFEASTLANITALRTQWMAATTVEEQVNLSNVLDSQLATIIVTYEAYPELHSVALVSNLMYEVAGTENRIATERMYYNDYVREYNGHIKSFPATWVAHSGDFEPREYYQSSNAPPAP